MQNSYEETLKEPVRASSEALWIIKEDNLSKITKNSENICE